MGRLLQGPVQFQGTCAPELIVTGVTDDSRQVMPGYLFVAVHGETLDGHQFIPAAVQRGAAVVVGTKEIVGLPVPYLRTSDARKALASLCSAFWGNPAAALTVIGVTGTDGKTTTSNLIYQVLSTAGIPVSMISTVSAVIGGSSQDTGFHVTTPQAPEIQKYLDQMVRQGMTHAVIETTSHGLAQYRVLPGEFDIGVVTNITHEHLDYHGSQEAYRQAKGRLFSELGTAGEKHHHPPRATVLNQDDESFEFLKSLVSVPLISYGFQQSAGLSAHAVELFANGIHFVAEGKTLSGRSYQIPITSQLLGIYNVYNILACVGVTASILEIKDEYIQEGIRSLAMVPGRMERIDMGQDFLAFVDFAHTPNALKSTLEAARLLTQGSVYVIFGSAGLRDRQKRRLMAEIAAGLADYSILTAEDPRTESLESILEEMKSGLEDHGGREGQSFWRIPDRGEAINFAVMRACAGDVVISCGKGHEQSMCFGKVEYPWDDRTAMQAAIADRLGIPGPRVPWLPTRTGNEGDEQQ
jgi:UDP-N-acetylmuramoyl-L-alanyl-D-glutamate--2,6-diaminopimelate ligase